jgi:AraC family transcriptional regulator
MEPRFENKKETQLLGKKKTMSFSENQTRELWQDFMPNRHLIQNKTGTDLYSLQVYPAGFFENFNPATPFTKWAAIEVSAVEALPPGMEFYTLPAGQYAVFNYKGAASAAAEVFKFILGTWLPGSGFALDDRPHFEILGAKFNKDSPESEEEIWIPVRQK